MVLPTLNAYGWLWGCGGLLLLSMCCGVGSAGYYFWQDGQDEIENKAPVKKNTVEKAKPKTKVIEEDTGRPEKVEEEEVEKPKALPKKSSPKSTTRSKPKTSSSSGRSGSSGSKKSTSSGSKSVPKKTTSSPPPPPPPPPSPPVAASPPPPTGPANVSFKSRGRGNIACAGETTSFDGPVNLNIDAYQLPATCMVIMEGKRGVFQVFGSGMVNCDIFSDEVSCGPQQVGK